MTVRDGKGRWWVAGVGLGVLLISLGVFLLRAGLDDADRWGSVFGAFLNIAGLAVAVSSAAWARRAAASPRPGAGGEVTNQIHGGQFTSLVLQGRDMHSGAASASPDQPGAGTAGAGTVPNRIEDGTFGGPVIQGRDMYGVLPLARPRRYTAWAAGPSAVSSRGPQPAAKPGSVSSTITGGVFLGTVIQGRDVQVMLPAEVTPAMTGLPRPAAVFTGRDNPLDTLLKSLSPGEQSGAMLVAAVAGMAGIGKTELVLQTAHRALHTTDWFPGGVLFVDMFGYDPDRRLSAADALLGWLQAIGIPGEHIPTAEADRARLWRSVLAAYVGQDRRLLLVIDNAADASQVAPMLPSAADVPVLITSRHTLDIDARLYDLDVLGTDAAVDLVCDVIAFRRGRVDSGAGDRQTMVELVGLCAGLPVALRIVAALLADRPQLQPAALAQQLRDAHHRLDRLSREQVVVRAAFDLSYQSLTDAQARLFRLLPVNPGPDIGTAAAARLADLPEEQATILLQDLHRAHLVDEPAAGRWRTHDLLRLHAGTQPPATPDEATTARARLFTYYQDTARAANTHLAPTTAADTTRFATRGQALTWLDAEHTHLVAVCTSGPSHQLPHTSTNLASTLARFLEFRRYFDDLITISTTAADICREAGDRPGEGQALNNLGVALTEVRRFDEAITALNQAADIYQQTGDRHSEAQALNNLGSALRQVRQNNEAINALTQAADIFQQTGDRPGRGLALTNLGSALWQVRRNDEAITAHTQAADIFQQTGDRHGKAQALGNLGIALAAARRYDEALAAYTQAADIFQQTGDRHGKGQALGNLGLALRQLRRFDEAITALNQAADFCQQTGDRHGEGRALINLGLALRQLRRFDEARSYGVMAVDAFTDASDAARAASVRQWLDELPPPADRDGLISEDPIREAGW